MAREVLSWLRFGEAERTKRGENVSTVTLMTRAKRPRFKIDVLKYDKCGGCIKLVAVVRQNRRYLAL